MRYAREIAKLEREGEVNWVLNLNEIAVRAMRFGDHAIARQALDEAILQIEIIYGNDPRARRARSLFYGEDSKVFKGDPYERSMTYFYRGVLYMQDGEWDNARACFRSALIMDAFAEDEQFQGDWALFDYLIGVCELQLNRSFQANESFALAQKSFAQFRNSYATLAPPRQTNVASLQPADYALWEGLQPFSPSTNLLVLTQHGKGPRKVAAGQYGQLLSYAPGQGSRDDAIIVVNSAPLGPPQITDSVYYQAVTRGGRELDAILGKQAVFKGVTGTAGEVGMLGGTYLLLGGLSSDNDDVVLVGAGLLAAGLVTSGLSALAQVRADIRAWRSLPDSLGFLPVRTSAGPTTIEVRFANETAVSTVNLPEPGEGLVVLLAFPPPAAALMSPPSGSRPVEPLHFTLN